MSILSPTNFETVDLGATSWRIIYNQDISDLNDYMAKFEDLWNNLVAADDNKIIKYNDSTGKWEKILIGVLSVNTTSVGTNADTLEKDLITFTLPANILNSNGKSLKINAWGTTASNSNTKTIRLKFGATTIVTESANIVGDSWWFKGIVVRTGASAQDAIGKGTLDGLAPIVTHSEPAEDTTATIDIKITGQNGVASANDIVAQGLMVELLN